MTTPSEDLLRHLITRAPARLIAMLFVCFFDAELLEFAASISGEMRHEMY